MEEDSGDGDALAFTAGQSEPALADDGVVAVGELDDPVVDRRRPRRLLNLVVGGLRLAVGDVRPQVVGEQVALLGHHPDRRRQTGEAQPTEIDAVEADGTSVGVVEPGDQAEHGRLAGAGRTDQRDQRAGACGEVDTSEHLLSGVVGEVDVVEGELATDLDRFEPRGVWSLDDVGLRVEILKDATEHGRRRLQLDGGLEQPGNREEEAVLQRREGDDH